MDWLTNFINPLIGGLPNVIQAILLLLVAWIFATIAKKITRKLIQAFIQSKAKTGTDGFTAELGNAAEMIGKIVFAIVFCLFLPGALEKLGMSSVSSPISGMASKFINFLPNLVAAIIIIAFGAFIAKLVMQLLGSLLKKTKLDTLQAKCGIEAKAGSGLSDIIAKLAYALIMVFAVVAGLQVLNISAISGPAINMVDQIFSILPKLCVAIILVAFGVFLANLVGRLLESILAGTGLDKLMEDIMPVAKDSGKKTAASKVIAVIVKVVINIIFIVSAVKVLQIEVLTSIGVAVIAYLPRVLAAVIIILLAWFVGLWVQKLILKSSPQSRAMAIAAKVAIFILAGFMALSQLGIAPHIVESLFYVMIVAAGVAAALAFGIGGRDFAKHTLDRVEKRRDEKK